MTGTPESLRLAHIADTHLGYSAHGKADPVSGRNQRAVDIEQSFAAAITDILRRDVDLVVHAGDAFHHTRPSWSTLAHFVRQMRRLEEAGIEAVVIAGNHDTPRLRTTGSVYGLLSLALPWVSFITGYETGEVVVDRLGAIVHGVPHGALTNPDPPAILPAPGKRNIVIAHGVVPGYVFTAGHELGEADVRGNVLDAQHDYIALGHVHLRGAAGLNAHYSGSTERTSWGDQLAKPSYALVTLGPPGSVPEITYVELPARPMETLEPIDGADRTARDLADMILARAGALGKPDAMVRVELRGVPRPLFRETDSIVRREIADNAWHIRLTAPGEVLDPIGRESLTTLAELHPKALFDAFVSSKERAGEYDATFASAFRERGSAALDAALTRQQEASAGEGPAS
jgi:exonuclease SbcD